MFARSFKGVIILSLFAALTPSAHAIGVGAAEASSFIGERLRARIPLFNVKDPDSLEIKFTSPQFGEVGQSVVTAVLDRSNSQLAISLTSNSVINEPYLDFNLELVDDGAPTSKEFTVLLNLSPLGVTPRPIENKTKRQDRSGISLSDLPTSASTLTRSVGLDSVMGPYDYAQPGQIPSRFGAVLDGQSLWRVARRINEAMGATRSQMMWALYQANPDAFMTKSVQSLRAGSYLNIPSEELVLQVSHEAAMANLSALSRGENVASAATKPSYQSNDVLAEFTSEPSAVNAEPSAVNAEPSAVNAEPSAVSVESSSALVKEASSTSGATTQASTSSFQVGGASELGTTLNAVNQAQEIIVSLSETVSNLTQQLEGKDKRIDSLETQISELKSFISEGAEFNMQSAYRDAINTSVGEFQSLSETTVVSQVEGQTQQAPVTINNIPKTETSTTLSKPNWTWGALALGLFAVGGILARRRIRELWHSLNLFGSNERVEFNDPALPNAPKVYSRNDAMLEHTAENESQTSKDGSKLSESKDYSEMVANVNGLPERTVEGISYEELMGDDGSYEPNDVLDFFTEKVEANPEDDLTFEERFNYLLDEKDFEFARELLDFARYNEINEDRYHFERLRLLEKMRDEDGFYKYYYEIEEQISDFPQHMQTEISQLVVLLAHH